MKKFLFLTLTFICFNVLTAQDIKKTIGEFTELKAFDLIEVELIKSDQNRVVISGDNKQYVSIINKNGTLKIRMKIEKRFGGNNTTVALYYTDIDIIDANEGASVFSNETIKQYELDLKTQEGGKIEVPVDIKFLNIKAVTGGVITATGKAESQKVTINTGGVCDAKNLEAENVKVSIRAGGEARVNAKELVDVNIRAGGNVYIYGDPKTIKENKALGGRVERVKNEK